MIEAYVGHLNTAQADRPRTKKLYTKVLDRVNTINGVRYGDDNAFWSIETGNEMK